MQASKLNFATPEGGRRAKTARRTLPHRLASLARDERGAAILLFALTLPVLLLVVGMAVDYGYLYAQRTRLQGAADAAAIAAARELHIADADLSQIRSVVESVVAANMGGLGAGVTVQVNALSEPLGVAVDLSQTVGLFFLDGLADQDGGPLRAHAVARPVGGTPVCVIGLDNGASETVSLDSNARLTAKTCAVVSNSRSSTGLSSKSNALLHAGFICSAGGAVGDSGNFQPDPLTDCPPIEDPLAARPAPPVGACTADELEIVDVTTTLHPGVYCGGLRIDGNARVRFQPGVYVIKDGPLSVDSNSEIEGEYVGFYLTGEEATFRFASNARVNLSAPKDGPMAGLLFYEDQASEELRRHEILSNFARVMVGTIYLPKGRFIVDADNEVADQSAYTAIIARRVELYAGPNLVLNTDYGLTDVPVPDGFGDTGRQIILAE